MQRNPTELDFNQFHQTELPQLLQTSDWQQAAQVARKLPPLAIELSDSGQSYTYSADEQGFHWQPGRENAATTARMSTPLWQGLASDLETVPGLLYGDKLSPGSEGDLGVFGQWEPVLRCLYHGLPYYRPDHWPIFNSAGEEIDPGTVFAADADVSDMREFIEAAGYLVIGDVFSEQELAVFREAAQTLRDHAVAGDNRSWWGKNSEGNAICTRVLNGGDAPELARLYDDPRITRLIPAMPEGLRGNNPHAVDGVTIIYKMPGMAEGLSDLPWHRDCGMGGHAHMCPAINLSIYLHDATPERGELRFLPGSHRASCGNMDGRKEFGVRADAKAGSVSLHYTDVMHAAPPPQPGQDNYRTSVLLNYTRHKHTHDGGRHYNDVLLGDEEGQIQHMDSVLKEHSPN